MENRFSGEVELRPKLHYRYEASWYIVDNTAVWDAFIALDGMPRSMIGGKVILAENLPLPAARIDDYVRDAIRNHVNLLL